MRVFNRVSEINQFKLHKKQQQAFRYLRDPSILSVLWGGSVSGGKSQLIAAWILWSALTFPDTRWLIGRKVLSDLMNSTVVSLFKVARDMGIENVLLQGWNKQRNTITFPNQSVILFRQLDPKADDVTFQELGSIELSGAAIDEAGQVDKLVYQTLIQRLRWNLPPHGGKILMCSNPSRNFCFDIFDQHEKGTLPQNMRYVHSTAWDNTFNDPAYLATLVRENFEEHIWESQILGNWRFESTDTQIIHASDVYNAFAWDTIGVDQREKYLTWDPAYGGADRSVVMLWHGNVMSRCWVWRQMDAMEQVTEAKRIIAENQIPSRNVSIDGIGSAALVAQFRGCVDHRANAKPLNGEAYASLKDQLYFRLGDALRKNELRFRCPEIRDELTQELVAHKAYRRDTDKNASVLPKEQVARAIKRSPDLADCVMQRMYFSLRKKEFTVDLVRW